MSRLFLICSCAIFVLSVALFSSNASERERSLQPDELYRLFGGATFTDRCCILNFNCVIPAEGCNSHGDDATCVTENDVTLLGISSDKCIVPAEGGANCEHSDDTHVCLKYFDCTYDYMRELCVNVINATYSNPDWCSDECIT